MLLCVETTWYQYSNGWRLVTGDLSSHVTRLCAFIAAAAAAAAVVIFIVVSVARCRNCLNKPWMKLFLYNFITTRYKDSQTTHFYNIIYFQSLKLLFVWWILNWMQKYRKPMARENLRLKLRLLASSIGHISSILLHRTKMRWQKKLKYDMITKWVEYE